MADLIKEPNNLRQKKVPNAAWAWEFLRRNPGYVHDYRAAAGALGEARMLRTGAKLLRTQKRHSAAEKWGLIHFADPAKGPFAADIFWRPDLLAGALNIRLSPVVEGQNDDAENHDVIILSAIKTRRVILDAATGVRHILLNGERFWIQLVCTPPIPVGEEASVKITIDGAVHAQRKLDTAAQLLSLHRSSGGQLSLIGRKHDADSLERALTAYDIWHGVGCNRGGYRQIAEALFGKARVAEEWTDPSRCLKDQSRRALKKGRRLVAGDYKNLLSKKAL